MIFDSAGMQKTYDEKIMMWENPCVCFMDEWATLMIL